MAAFVVTVVAVAGLIGVSPREGWWWDGIWLAQAQVIFNVLGALLAAGAVIYAWRVATKQFEMMQEQDSVIRKQLEMMQEQANISRRLEGIENDQRDLLRSQERMAKRQGKMIKRQGQIAEDQQRTMKEQLARQEDLRMYLDKTASDQYSITYNIGVMNHGDKTADSFYWRLCVPLRWSEYLRIEAFYAAFSQPDVIPLHNQSYELHEEYWDRAVFPTAIVIIGTLTVVLSKGFKPFEIEWNITSERGANPPDTNGIFNVPQS